MINPTKGWNTWNYECLTALSYVDGAVVEIEVRVSVFDEERVEHIRDIRWRDVVRLGPHAFDGAYMRLEFQAGFEARFALEAAASDRTLTLSVTPTRTSAKRVVVEVHRPGRSSMADRTPQGLVFDDWVVAADGAEPHGAFCISSAAPALVGLPGGPMRVVVAPRALGPAACGALVRGCDATLAESRGRHEGAIPVGEGEMAGALEAMQRAAAWNTVYDLGGRGVCTTASRDWCQDWHGVVLFGWDTFFHGLIAGVSSPDTAWANYAAVLSGVTDEGFVPNWRLSGGAATLDRSQPPVGAYCVWRTHLRHPNRDRLNELYPALLRWHEWWPTARATPDGLLAWGSNPRARYAFPELRQRMFGAQICCCYESGMDNSPMFDGVPYDPVSGLMLQADVGLTALYTVDGLCLAAIAREIGRVSDADRLAADAAQIRRRMTELMWDDRTAIFRNRLASGTLSDRVSPTSFYPLLCGPEAIAADRTVRENLLNPLRFWGEFPLPSISRDAPDFRDNDYWRGRIWAPMVALVYDGLRSCGMDGPASELARRSLRLLLRGWNERNAVYENYNAVTGEGGDVPNADPLYVWGGLLGYAGLQELVDVRDDGIHFGSPSDLTASVRNLIIRGAAYDVETGPNGVRVNRGGKELVRTDAPRRVIVPFRE